MCKNDIYREVELELQRSGEDMPYLSFYPMF